MDFDLLNTITQYAFYDVGGNRYNALSSGG